MNFEEEFKSWTLEQKVEWALGPYICNLSENMRSIIVDLKAENEQLKKDLEHARSYKHTIKMRNRNLNTENERLKGENAKLKCLALHLFSKLFVYMNIHYHTLFKCALDDEYEFEQTACASIKYKRKCEKTNELLIKYDEAYRKAKNELKDGK